MNLGRNDKSEKKEEMAYDEAMEVIDVWCEDLEVRLIGNDLQDVKNEIWKAVQKKRLIYDAESEVFTYILKKPIEPKDGSQNISMIKIHETSLADKKEITKKKSDIDTQTAMIHAYCKDSEMEEIAIGFLTRIKDRDNSIISAVILGFFVQTVPSARSAD